MTGCSTGRPVRVSLPSLRMTVPDAVAAAPVAVAVVRLVVRAVVVSRPIGR